MTVLSEVLCPEDQENGTNSTDAIERLASGMSLVEGAGTQIREGVVIRPLKERWDERLGRVQLKLVSNDYLAR